MTDNLLVPRLREVYNLIQLPVAGEAADEIERLRAALKRLASENEKMLEALVKYDDLVNYEYEGTPDAIVALQEASAFAFDVMAKISND